jgi:hypothetical protein
MMFSINWKDLAKGLVVAVLAAVVAYFQQNLNGIVDWNAVLQVAEAAALAYVTKNFFTNENGQFMGRL